ncbi:hypothetical protein HKD37_19G054568 [Glycine soja]
MADAKPSPAGVDRLEAAMAKLAAAQLHLESTLDDLLLKLPLRTSHHYPSSSFVQSPLPLPPSRLTASPCPIPMQHNQSPLSISLPTPTPSPMPTAPPCPAPVQPFLPLLSGPLPMPVLHLPNLDLICTAISFNKLINIVPLYDHAVVTNDKPWTNKDTSLFEMGYVSYGIAMTAYKLQPISFALCTTTKPSAIRRNRSWDPGIVFGRHSLKTQHLEDNVFFMGSGNDRIPEAKDIAPETEGITATNEEPRIQKA